MRGFSGAQLSERVLGADLHGSDHSFGVDIDTVHETVFDPCVPVAQKCETLRGWLSRHQPCLFGRLGARSLKGVGFTVAWLDEADIARGDEHLRVRVQDARRNWKDAAAQGASSGLLIMFSSPALARVKPGRALVEISKSITEMYFPEFAPVAEDMIYTESAPLKTDRGLVAFKAGVNLFYPSAHGTANHDRRVPGGIMLSVNSVGHLANSLVKRGKAENLEGAARQMLDLALRSIGNGGLGLEARRSCTWHNEAAKDETEPAIALPRHLEGRSISRYSSLYNTDVTIPRDVTVAAGNDCDPSRLPVWRDLPLDYLSSQVRPQDHEDYGFFHGQLITEEQRQASCWPPMAVTPPSASPRQSLCPVNHDLLKRAIGAVKKLPKIGSISRQPGQRFVQGKR